MVQQRSSNKTFYSLQVQALVGFEKTIKHLDDHLVDISTKVGLKIYPL